MPILPLCCCQNSPIINFSTSSYTGWVIRVTNTLWDIGNKFPNKPNFKNLHYLLIIENSKSVTFQSFDNLIKKKTQFQTIWDGGHDGSSTVLLIQPLCLLPLWRELKLELHYSDAQFLENRGVRIPLDSPTFIFALLFFHKEIFFKFYTK